jgi:hypothetical protein
MLVSFRNLVIYIKAHWEIIWPEVLWMPGQGQLSFGSLSTSYLHRWSIQWEVMQAKRAKGRGHQKSPWPGVWATHSHLQPLVVSTHVF